MKSKKAKKIVSAIVGLALVLAAPLAFAGCASKVSLGEGLEIVKNAAHNYFDNRTGYENFADTTFENTLVLNMKTEDEAEYRASALGEEERWETTTVERSNLTEATRTLYVKNVGTKEKPELALKLVVNGKNTSVEYVTNNDGQLERKEEIKDTKTVYVLTPITQDGEMGYFLIKNEKIANDETKSYLQYESRDSYIEAVMGIIHQMNEAVVADSFFDLMDNDMLDMFAQVEKDGKNLKIYTGDVKYFDISKNYQEDNFNSEEEPEYTVKDSLANIEITYKDNRINTYKSKMAGEMFQGVNMTMDVSLTIKDGAKVTIDSSVEGYTEMADLYVKPGDLPSNSLFNS